MIGVHDGVLMIMFAILFVELARPLFARRLPRRHTRIVKTEVESAPGRIEIDRVSKSFETPEGCTTILCNVTAAFEPGTFTVLLGSSGSGKSTMLRLIAGLEAADPTCGDIIVGGVRLSQDRRQLREHLQSVVAVITQGDALAPSLTLTTNVALSSLLKGNGPHEAYREARALLCSVGLEAHADKRPHQVSGGQALRVALARALAHDAPIILADEPDANLDGHNSELVFQRLRAEADLGKTVIIATHDERARAFADRVLLIEDRRLVEQVQSRGRFEDSGRACPTLFEDGESKAHSEVDRQSSKDDDLTREIDFDCVAVWTKPPKHASRFRMSSRSRLLVASQHARHTWATALVLVAAAVLMASVPVLVSGGLARALIEAVDRSIDQATVRRVIVQPADASASQDFGVAWIEEWRHEPHIASVTGLIEAGVQVQGATGEPIYAVMEGVAPDDPRFAEPPTGIDGLDDTPSAVIPSGLARRLGVHAGDGEVILTLQRFAKGLRYEREVTIRVSGITDRSDGNRIYVAPVVADAADSWLMDGTGEPTGRSFYRASVFADRIESIAPLVARLERAGLSTRHHLDQVGQVVAARTLVFGLANAVSIAFAFAGMLGILLYALSTARQNLRTTGVFRLVGASDRDVMLTLGLPPVLAAVLGFVAAVGIATAIAPRAQAVLEQALGGLSLTGTSFLSSANLMRLVFVGVGIVGLVAAVSALFAYRTCRLPITRALRTQV